MTVLGTRPEIIRLSRIIPKLDATFEHTLVHTGQNSAHSLSDVFFRELEIREPDVQLGVDTSNFGRQLATLFEGFERILDDHRPDRLLILGDTNSALIAYNAKRRGIPVFHMEAGNRCYDDRVPEEVNRRVIDHCSEVLMPYTNRSAENLVREGIGRQRIFVTGNPIYEVLSAYQQAIDSSSVLNELSVKPIGFLLATMHRAENVDQPAVLAGLCQALTAVAELYAMPLLLSVHPRTRQRLAKDAFAGTRVIPVDALPFFSYAKLQKEAALVLSDSGTVQEECAIFGVPAITIRNTTERPETIECGSNVVSSTDPTKILAAARFLHASAQRGSWSAPPEYVDPCVSDKVIRILLSNLPPR
jgi:UDP-N-acetylglucosamine 2-epimerase (non-hydrolysing)